MYTVSDKKLIMLRPREIRASGRQVRKNPDEYGLKLLTDSIRASGIIQPLAVRRLPDGHYELISGERRLRAALRAGLRRVPCIVHKVNDETAAFFSVTENLRYSPLNMFEEAEALNALITDFGISQAEAAEKLGISQTALSNRLRLLHLADDLQKTVISAELTERHARALLRLPEENRREVLDRIIADELTPGQTEDRIFDLLNPEYGTGESDIEPVRKISIGDIRLFSNSLSKLVSTLKSAGFVVHYEKHEDKYRTEFTVRIENCTPVPYEGEQLKICRCT